MAYQNQMQTPYQQPTIQERKKEIDEVVASKIQTYNNAGEIDFPANYSHQNALKSAWLKLQNVQDKAKRPALQTCTTESIANTLFEMVVLGLDPVKNQCYFIVKGNQLTLEMSYFGHMAITKRVAGVKEIFAQVVFEGDNVSYEIVGGRVTNLRHSQSFGNINKDKIIGAYCVIEFEDGTSTAELMSIDELQTAWGKSKMYKDDNNEGAVHREFRQEMAKKTVIKRTCKKFLNSSDNADLMNCRLEESENRAVEAEVFAEISSNANKTALDFDTPTTIEAPSNVTGDGEIIERFEGELVSEPVYAHTPHVEKPDMYEKVQDEKQFTGPNSDDEPF